MQLPSAPGTACFPNLQMIRERQIAFGFNNAIMQGFHLGVVPVLRGAPLFLSLEM